jgi:hypothetical protein
MSGQGGQGGYGGGQQFGRFGGSQGGTGQSGGNFQSAMQNMQQYRPPVMSPSGFGQRYQSLFQGSGMQPPGGWGSGGGVMTQGDPMAKPAPNPVPQFQPPVQGDPMAKPGMPPPTQTWNPNQYPGGDPQSTLQLSGMQPPSGFGSSGGVMQPGMVAPNTAPTTYQPWMNQSQPMSWNPNGRGGMTV